MVKENQTIQISNKYLMLILLFCVGLFILAINPASAISSTGWTVSGQNTYFDGTDNVGIGTATPGAKLDVYGIIRSQNTSNGAPNQILKTSNGSYNFALTTLDSNELYIGRLNGGGGTYDDLIIGTGVSAKAPTNGGSTLVNISSDNSTRFGGAVVNGPSSGTGTYYFGTTSGAGSGVSRTYMKIDHSTGTMCLGNC
jgi:hypothetical protein